MGGLTRGLAQTHPVLALDRSSSRLSHARANLAAQVPSHPVSWLACDLTRPALRTPATPRFSGVVMDPDWSPAGSPLRHWAARLGDMRPAADALIAWALAFGSRLVLRLPRDLPEQDWPAPGPVARLPVYIDGTVDFIMVFLGRWPGLPSELRL